MDNKALSVVSTAIGRENAIDVELNSPAIARLIKEVRSADFEASRAYNRTYNRHNR